MRQVRIVPILRPLVTLASAASALLLVAALVFWVRDRSVDESFQWTYAARRAVAAGEKGYTARSFFVSTGRGTLWITYGWMELPKRDPTRDPPDYGWSFRYSEWTAAAPSPAQLSGRGQWGFVKAGLMVAGRDEVPPAALAARDPYTYYANHSRTVALPFWMLVVATAILPTLIVARWWRGRISVRDGEHLCPECGYDLRATPERCPECGKVAVARPAA